MGRQSGSPVTAVGEELGGGSAEHANALGWVFWMNKTTTELWDTMVRRGGDGGRGNSERRRQARSGALRGGSRGGERRNG